MIPTTLQIVETMQTNGGSFIKKLTTLWLAADPVRKLQVQKSFQKDFDYYEHMWTLIQSHSQPTEQ